MLFRGPLVDRLQHIRAEFDETPGLRVSLAEAAERWALDAASLEVILDRFVDVGLLERSSDGAYVRRAGRRTV